MLQKLKLPIIIILVLFAGFIAYDRFFKERLSEGLEKKPATNSSPEKNILPLLSKLSTINFDGSIFNDPAFQSLHDYGKQVQKEESGRPNPFAPSFSNSSATSTLRGPAFDLKPPSETQTQVP